MHHSKPVKCSNSLAKGVLCVHTVCGIICRYNWRADYAIIILVHKIMWILKISSAMYNKINLQAFIHVIGSLKQNFLTSLVQYDNKVLSKFGQQQSETGKYLIGNNDNNYHFMQHQQYTVYFSCTQNSTSIDQFKFGIPCFHEFERFLWNFLVVLNWAFLFIYLFFIYINTS